MKGDKQEMKLYSLRNGLGKARKRKGLKQTDLAEKMNVTLKTVMNWEQGIVNPDLETMMKLSELLECDLDYLTGRLKESTHDIQFVSEFTGLSEEAINKISDPQIGNPFGKTLSRMVESERFQNFISSYRIYLHFLERLSASDLEEQNPWFQLDDDRVVLTKNQAAIHFRQEVVSSMNSLCEEDYIKAASRINDFPDRMIVEFGDGSIRMKRIVDRKLKELEQTEENNSSERGEQE